PSWPRSRTSPAGCRSRRRRPSRPTPATSRSAWPSRSPGCTPADAVDKAHRAYYAARAREYDDWWLGRGLFASRDRPGWPEEVRELERLLASLPPARTLDAACGTGFMTRHLRGLVVGLDQSAEMCALAQRRLHDGVAVVGDALALPFPDRAFDRVVAGHFYGHPLADQRARF